MTRDRPGSGEDGLLLRSVLPPPLKNMCRNVNSDGRLECALVRTRGGANAAAF